MVEVVAQADPDERGAYPFEIAHATDRDPYQFDPAPALRALIADRRAGASIPAMAARFHNGVAALIRDCCVLAREQTALNTVALSGGVFQNKLLLTRAADLLRAAGFTVLTHALVPANDGGLALGQAAIAARTVEKNSGRL